MLLWFLSRLEYIHDSSRISGAPSTLWWCWGKRRSIVPRVESRSCWEPGLLACQGWCHCSGELVDQDCSCSSVSSGDPDLISRLGCWAKAYPCKLVSCSFSKQGHGFSLANSKTSTLFRNRIFSLIKANKKGLLKKIIKKVRWITVLTFAFTLSISVVANSMYIFSTCKNLRAAWMKVLVPLKPWHLGKCWFNSYVASKKLNSLAWVFCSFIFVLIQGVNTDINKKSLFPPESYLM